MTSFDKTSLEDLVSTKLPGLSEEIISQLADKLLSMGVTQTSHLNLVEPTDLQPPLNVIQARIFMKTFKTEGED